MTQMKVYKIYKRLSDAELEYEFGKSNAEHMNPLQFFAFTTNPNYLVRFENTHKPSKFVYKIKKMSNKKYMNFCRNFKSYILEENEIFDRYSDEENGEFVSIIIKDDEMTDIDYEFNEIESELMETGFTEPYIMCINEKYHKALDLLGISLYWAQAVYDEEEEMSVLGEFVTNTNSYGIGLFGERQPSASPNELAIYIKLNSKSLRKG